MKQLPDIENRADKHFDGSRVVLASENVYSYYFCTRAKKSAPWIPVAFARAPGDCSPAHAAQAFNRFIPPEIDDIAEDLRDIAEDIYIPVED